MKKFYHYQSYNTSTSQNICGVWLTDINVIKELHLNKYGSLFIVVYGDEGGGLFPVTVEEAIDFIQTNRNHIKWFPGGSELFQDIMNNNTKNFS